MGNRMIRIALVRRCFGRVLSGVHEVNEFAQAGSGEL
jgi:hypothetical protein